MTFSCGILRKGRTELPGGFVMVHQLVQSYLDKIAEEGPTRNSTIVEGGHRKVTSAVRLRGKPYMSRYEIKRMCTYTHIRSILKQGKERT